MHSYNTYNVAKSTTEYVRILSEHNTNCVRELSWNQAYFHGVYAATLRQSSRMILRALST